jgi:hypothetical protein
MQLVVDFGEKRPEETEEDALKRHNEVRFVYTIILYHLNIQTWI